MAAGIVLLIAGVLGLAWVYEPEIEWGAFSLTEASPLPALASAVVTPGRAGEERVLTGDRVRIPRLGMDVAVSGGDREAALAAGAWWHAGSAAPGTGGNTALAGHRVRRVFARLGKARPGDEITLVWDRVRYRYRVTKVFVVDPSDVGILAQSGPERLTLYSCIPRVFGNRRTVVVAEPIP